MEIKASDKKQKLASDILIEYFIAKNNYKSFMECGYQDQQSYLMEADLSSLKPHITDQISIGPFEQVFGKSKNGTPIGFAYDRLVAIYFLDFEKNVAFTKIIPKSDYYLYLSICHSQIENTEKPPIDI